MIVALSGEDHKFISAQLIFIERNTYAKTDQKNHGRMGEDAVRLGTAQTTLGLGRELINTLVDGLPESALEP